MNESNENLTRWILVILIGIIAIGSVLWSIHAGLHCGPMFFYYPWMCK